MKLQYLLFRDYTSAMHNTSIVAMQEVTSPRFVPTLESIVTMVSSPIVPMDMETSIRGFDEAITASVTAAMVDWTKDSISTTSGDIRSPPTGSFDVTDTTQGMELTTGERFTTVSEFYESTFGTSMDGEFTSVPTTTEVGREVFHDCSEEQCANTSLCVRNFTQVRPKVIEKQKKNMPRISQKSNLFFLSSNFISKEKYLLFSATAPIATIAKIAQRQ